MESESGTNHGSFVTKLSDVQREKLVEAYFDPLDKY